MDLLHHSIYHSRLQLRRCGRGEGWAHSCYHGNICSGKSVSTEGLSSGEQLVGNALGTHTDFHLRTIWNGNWTPVSYHTIAQGLRRLTMPLLLYFVGLTQHNLSVHTHYSLPLLTHQSLTAPVLWSSCTLTTLPPPNPTLTTSGSRKLVATPPT